MAQVLIITGMHRSGTSLVASLLARAGVPIGTQLLPADQGNPRGYFEDEDFVQLHQAMLTSRAQSTMVARGFMAIATADERVRAGQLIAQRSDLALWGWKDPRTCLFLDLWQSLLPDALYLFVYRSPIDVLLSLMRRGEPFMAGLVEALEAWYSYNSHIQQFVVAHPARCLLCQLGGALQRTDVLAQLLADRLGSRLNLGAETVAALYQPEELRTLPITREDVAALAEIHPESVVLYQELERHADIAGPRDLAWRDAPSAALDLPMVERRVRLIALCARLDPHTTERFYARGDHDLSTLQYHTNTAYAHAERMERAALAAQAAHAEAEAYARALEAALAEREVAFRELETYTRSLEAERARMGGF